ncbi:collagen binding domain-containing protein [Lactococcus lactis]|uniref:collagen binding domain-containing protein n=1 Tax=Lactococcus lactis TaxID=1358 RepID=UPI0022E646EC|nr:collagen binding domain-containing protein [Lactococcus lactis]
MRKKRIFLIMLMFLVTIILSWNSNSGYAATGNDVSEDITSLTVSPTDVRDGAKVSVRFEFDEQSKNIQPGDYFNINWPNTGSLFAQGYTKTIDLQVSGKVVGTMVIKTEGAQVIFNDNIKNLDEVKGWGAFDVQVRNLTAGNAENIGSLTISSGEKTARVNVTKPASETTSSVFYYKTGDMLPQDTQHIRWFLNINSGRVEVDDAVIIKDQIQVGQQLDPSTFIINVDDVSGVKTYRGESDLLKLTTDYPGISLVYSTNTNTLELHIPASVARYRHFGVQYKTVIDNNQQASFDNKSQAWYHEHGQSVVSGEDFNYSVKNINASGGVEGTVKGQLKVVKRVEGTEVGIPNVKFSLKRADGEPIQGQDVITLTSDMRGEAGIKGLLVGDYLLQEIFAPDWINFDPLTSPQQKFTVNDTDTSGIDLTIYNKKKTTDVTAKKVWKGGITPRPTTYFKLYRSNVKGVKEEVPDAALKALTDGITEVTWSNLVAYDDHGGSYNFSVQEVDENGNDSVPTGYSKTENGLLVINTKEQEVPTIQQRIPQAIPVVRQLIPIPTIEQRIPQATPIVRQLIPTEQKIPTIEQRIPQAIPVIRQLIPTEQKIPAIEQRIPQATPVVRQLIPTEQKVPTIEQQTPQASPVKISAVQKKLNKLDEIEVSKSTNNIVSLNGIIPEIATTKAVNNASGEIGTAKNIESNKIINALVKESNSVLPTTGDSNVNSTILADAGLVLLATAGIILSYFERSKKVKIPNNCDDK